MNIHKSQVPVTVSVQPQVSNEPKLTPPSRHSFDVATRTSRAATGCPCFKSSKVQDNPTNSPPIARTRSVTHPAKFPDQATGTMGTIKNFFQKLQRPSQNQLQEEPISSPKQFDSPVPGAWQEQTDTKERKRYSEENAKKGELNADSDFGEPKVENFGDEDDFYQQFGLRAGEQHRRFEILRPSDSDKSIPEENEKGSTEAWNEKNLTPRSREGGTENETKMGSEAYEKLEDSPPASPTSASSASTRTSIKTRLSNLAQRVSSHLPFSKAKSPTDKTKPSDQRTGMISLGNGKTVTATLHQTKTSNKRSIFKTMTLAAKTILSKKNPKSNTSSTVAQIPKTATPFDSLSINGRNDIEKWMKNLQEEDKEAINKWLEKHPNITPSEFTGEIFSELCEISCVKPIFSWAAPEFCGLEKADIELLPILLSLRELFIQNNTDETSNKTKELIEKLKGKIEELKEERQKIDVFGNEEEVSVWSQFNIGGPDKLKLENLDTDNVDQNLIKKMCNEIISMDRTILINNSGKHLNLLMNIMKSSV